jgi:CxxC-x17-CxxC domain-containing protein
MYQAVCSACGGEAQVPFKPRGDKPIYCRSCFQNQASNY